MPPIAAIAPVPGAPPADSLGAKQSRDHEGAFRQNRRALAAEALSPNWIVRSMFCLSIFAVPFMRVYLPGTGDRVGVERLVQVLIFCAMVCQPRICLRFIPTALFWFVAYCAVQIVCGLWLTPELRNVWFPRTLHWLQFSLPWVWVLFNVLNFPGMGRSGLWALAWGCSLCALLHIAGIGVVEITNGIDGRSSVFGENANIVGATYAVAGIAISVLVAYPVVGAALLRIPQTRRCGAAGRCGAVVRALVSARPQRRNFVERGKVPVAVRNHIGNGKIIGEK